MARIDRVRSYQHQDLKGRILGAITRGWPRGLTRTEISKSLSYKISSREIAGALQELLDRGLIRGERTITGRKGRPKETWFKI